MIFAGLLLAAVGAADLVRQFAPRRWVGYLIGAVALLALGVLADAVLPALVALALGAGWVWSMPNDRRGALSFWPAVVLAVVSITAVAVFGPRPAGGLLGAVWQLDSPAGPVPLDLAVLACGAALVLLESGNVVVRAALAGERRRRPEGGDGVVIGAAGEISRPPFAGGRLIGPLERMLVLLLTLAAAYPLLAAVLAAKGIVRFPEISRDGENGVRAEYFLVGTLVSWVMALGGAFLVRWGSS